MWVLAVRLHFADQNVEQTKKTSFHVAFAFAEDFNGDISAWDTSKIRQMNEGRSNV